MEKRLVIAVTFALALAAPAAADTTGNVRPASFAPAVTGPAVQRVQTRVILNTIQLTTQAAVARARARERSEPRDR